VKLTTRPGVTVHCMTDERLSPAEQAAWGGFLDTHTRLIRAMETSLSAVGVTVGEYDVLVALEAAGEAGVRMSDLAARRLMSTGGFTRLADRLERQGLIIRQRSATDGRGLNAVITPNGLQKLRGARKRHLDDVRALFVAPLEPEQLTQLEAIWKRLGASDSPDSC
jgi:DNA-binding MarR family transcriptional regulator